ncbi:MAG TPA: small membrane protein YoaI [Scandinavium sp.]|jgi:hypothetical protein|nr:small membrane protein YoaI [Scandinavium sp.]HEX4502258.1 small membrane protein YoaI [Scandinavium sp.]
MHDPLFIEALIMLFSFLSVGAVLVASVLLLERYH